MKIKTSPPQDKGFSEEFREYNQCKKIEDILYKSFRTRFAVNSYKDFEKIPAHLLAQVIPLISSDRIKTAQMWQEDVAPRELLLADFSKCLVDEKLMYASSQSTTDLLIRAIPGHAQNKHSLFTRTYPNTTTVNVLDAISPRDGKMYTRNEFGKRSQGLINSIVSAAEEFFIDAERSSSSSVAYRKLVSSENQPVAQLSIFNGVTVNMVEFLRGFYFASKMDTYDGVRSKVFEKYGHQMGGGNCHAMNFDLLPGLGIGLHDLSEIRYHGPLDFMNSVSPKFREEFLEKLRVIVAKPNSEINSKSWKEIQEQNTVNSYLHPQIQSAYHRLYAGNGCSDDIAVVLAGFLPQTNTNDGHIETPHDIPSRILGALMADKIDTLEKDSNLIFPIGQDEYVGDYFNSLFSNACQKREFREKFNIRRNNSGEYNLVSDSVIVDFTAASANRETTIHSSQRYFLKLTEGTCAVREYMAHAAAYAKVVGREFDSGTAEYIFNRVGASTPKIQVTFDRLPLYSVLNEMNERLALVKDPHLREKRLYEFFRK